MKICLLRFNTVLLLVLICLGTGCQSFKKKHAATFRLYLEKNTPDVVQRSQVVDIGQEGMFTLRVEQEPFLDEGHVLKASVVKALGGFQIMVEFNRQGSWILEQYTTRARGQRIGIYAAFGKARWLAAPQINHTIKNGVLTFTPDATFEEAKQLVEGLNDVAKVMQKNNP